MKNARPRTPTHRLARAGTTLLAATALAAGGLLAAASSASAATPLVSTCVNLDPSHISVSVDGSPGLLGGLPNVATVTLTDGTTGQTLGVSPSISLLNGLIHLDLASLALPAGLTDLSSINYSIAPLLSGILTPITGSASCIGLPSVTGAYVAVPPTRILDTRYDVGGITIPALSSIVLAVAGHAGIPGLGGLLGLPGSAPSAVNINFTATNATAPGFVTVYPSGTARPTSSNLNFAAGHDVANTTIAKLGADGGITIYNSSVKSVDLVGDVSGYYVTGLVTPLLPLVPGAYQPLATQVRLLDTRNLGVAGKLAYNKSLTLAVTGKAGVPVGADSVVLNVTSTDASFAGHLRVYAAGGPVPLASNVNFTANRTVANEVVVKPNAAGQISIYNGGLNSTTDVVVDIIGYIAGGLLPVQTAGLQTAVTPLRLLDTRYATGTPTATRVLPGGTRVVKVAGVGQIPTTASDAVITVTAVNEDKTGFATVYSGATRPLASILNFLYKIEVANVMIAPIAADGTITIYNGSTGPQGSTDLVIDVSAYITGPTLSIG